VAPTRSPCTGPTARSPQRPRGPNPVNTSTIFEPIPPARTEPRRVLRAVPDAAPAAPVAAAFDTVDVPAAPGAVTTAAFASVGDLEAAADEAELTSRLGETDKARLEDMARQGYLDGHERGLGEGYRAGLEQAVQEITARLGGALSALTAAAQQLSATEAVTLAELDTRVTAFALDIAEQVIGHELAAATEPGRDALARAIALAPDRGQLTARLNPVDLAGLDSVEELAPGREVTIVADPAVAPGGCILDVGACRIDAQLGPALDRVRQVLGGHA
jgi:flagellar assembly protein FliH